MSSKAVLAALAAVFMSTSAFAGEHLLGATLLSGIYDRDIIRVRGICPSAVNPLITSLKITVRKRAAHIEQLEVRYGDGVWDNLPVREQFGAGSSSRWIDLRGGARCVEAVRIVGHSEVLRLEKQSLIEVYGR